MIVSIELWSGGKNGVNARGWGDDDVLYDDISMHHRLHTLQPAIILVLYFDVNHESEGINWRGLRGQVGMGRGGGGGGGGVKRDDKLYVLLHSPVRARITAGGIISKLRIPSITASDIKK